MTENKNNILWKYAGLATQFFIALGLAVFGGLKVDQWLNLKNPMAVWIFPLLVIIIIIYKIVKDTAPKSKS